MSVTTGATVRSEENLKVTRSRRNVAWTGLGALVVVVVLALFPYIVYSATTCEKADHYPGKQQIVRGFLNGWERLRSAKEQFHQNGRTPNRHPADR